MLAIYCRKSKKVEEGTDLSIPTQKEEGVKFAKENGYDYKFYIDEGISGAKDDVESRPEFAQMLRDINQRNISMIWCIDQSRIERNSLVWELFILEVNKAKCNYYPNGVPTDLTDPQTQFITRVLSANAKLFTQITSKKVKLAIGKNVKEGKAHGLKAYGYYSDENKVLRIKEEEAKHVRDMFKWSLEGIGAYTIANKLNDKEVPTRLSTFGVLYVEGINSQTQLLDLKSLTFFGVVMLLVTL